jgi:hypothetical protein
MAVQEKAAPADDRHVETESAMNRSAFAYSPWRFFQVMLAVAWSAFAHPFTTTIIDLDTGRAYKENGEERP